jgi:hypothetical protein
MKKFLPTFFHHDEKNYKKVSCNLIKLCEKNFIKKILPTFFHHDEKIFQPSSTMMMKKFL